MNERTKERTGRLLCMGRGQLVMHAQDLTQQCDELLEALEEIAEYPEQDAGEMKRIAREALAKVGADKEE